MSTLLVFVFSALASYGLNLILIQYSKRLGSLSAGNTSAKQVRWASSSKPLVGGVTFFVIFLIAAMLYPLVFSPDPHYYQQSFMPFILSVSLGFVVGLWDDAYTTKPLVKLGGQIGCAVVLLAFGRDINLFDNIWLDGAITVFWVIGIMNSINMLDNMDGITGSVSLGIVAVVLGFMLASAPSINVFSFILFSLAGSLVGFLVLNWNPSKLYMGDTGSQFLGALLAAIGIDQVWNRPTLAGDTEIMRQILMAVLVFLMPIMDTTFVTIARLKRGQSPMVGGKDHITHHLSYLGLRDKYIPIVTSAVTLLSGGLALFLYKTDEFWRDRYTALALAYVVGMFLIFFVLYQIGAKNKALRERFRSIQNLRIKRMQQQTANPVAGVRAVAKAPSTPASLN